MMAEEGEPGRSQPTENVADTRQHSKSVSQITSYCSIASMLNNATGYYKMHQNPVSVVAPLWTLLGGVYETL